MNYLLPVLAVVAFLALLYWGRGYWAWMSVAVLLFFEWARTGVQSIEVFAVAVGLAVAVAVLFGLPVVRRTIVSAAVMRAVRSFLPQMGDTERIALEAGTIWWDGELFSGNPDWRRLLGLANHLH